jgi:hypothetical protein
MMAGETLPECEVCNDRLLNVAVYRDYFWHLFKDRLDEIWDSTDPTGSTHMRPVSWDYRFSNLCNFKCRTCGDMLSSAWESEQKQNNMVDWNNPKNNWMRDGIRAQIKDFQENQVEAEFAAAVEGHAVEEVYWVGGEPLMYEQHWRYMKRIIELGDGKNVYARYNTNLSRIDYRGVNLYRDILAHVRDWQICASIDGLGPIGEYIRTSLSSGTFINNFRQGLEIARHPRQMRFDFTLTLPGMFEVTNIMNTARELGVDVLAKVTFAFTPDIVMSPLCLPRNLLDHWVDELVTQVPPGAMRDVLTQLKNRPSFDEQWPDQYQEGWRQGKKRILRLESIRKNPTTMDEILSQRADVHAWWKAIDA